MFAMIARILRIHWLLGQTIWHSYGVEPWHSNTWIHKTSLDDWPNVIKMEFRIVTKQTRKPFEQLEKKIWPTWQNVHIPWHQISDGRRILQIFGTYKSHEKQDLQLLNATTKQKFKVAFSCGTHFCHHLESVIANKFVGLSRF